MNNCELASLDLNSTIENKPNCTPLTSRNINIDSETPNLIGAWEAKSNEQYYNTDNCIGIDANYPSFDGHPARECLVDPIIPDLTCTSDAHTAGRDDNLPGREHAHTLLSNMYQGTSSGWYDKAFKLCKEMVGVYGRNHRPLLPETEILTKNVDKLNDNQSYESLNSSQTTMQYSMSPDDNISTIDLSRDSDENVLEEYKADSTTDCEPVNLTIKPSQKRPLDCQVAKDIPSGKRICTNLVVDVNAGHVNLINGNSVYRDMEVISTMLPNIAPEEIYAYLEAHYFNPNRIQVVVDEFLSMEPNDDDDDDIEIISCQTISSSTQFKHGRGKDIRYPSDNVEHNQSTPVVIVIDDSDDEDALEPESLMQRDLKILQEITPNADPNFLLEKLQSVSHNHINRVEIVGDWLVENPTYPKWKDSIQTKMEEERKCAIRGAVYGPEDFLKMFDDPVKHFYDKTKFVTSSYRAHAQAQLKLYFPFLHEMYIHNILAKRNGHFTPALRMLENAQKKSTGKQIVRKTKYLLVKREEGSVVWPNEPNESFYQELQFTQQEREIKEHLKKKKVPTATLR